MGSVTSTVQMVPTRYSQGYILKNGFHCGGGGHSKLSEDREGGQEPLITWVSLCVSQQSHPLKDLLEQTLSSFRTQLKKHHCFRESSLEYLSNYQPLL